MIESYMDRFWKGWGIEYQLRGWIFEGDVGSLYFWEVGI